MMTLYIKSGCPYSAAVLAKLDDLNLAVEKKNIADEGVLEELENIGEKHQVPFLHDKECGAKIYESDLIIEYLNDKYGNASVENLNESPKGICPS